MDPVAFRLGSLTVRWYGIAYAVALLVGLEILRREVSRKELDLDFNDLIDFVLISFPLGLVGARIYYAIFYLDYFRRNPLALFGFGGGGGFGLSGLAIHGGLIGGLAGLLRLMMKEIWIRSVFLNLPSTKRRPKLIISGP